MFLLVFNERDAHDLPNEELLTNMRNMMGYISDPACDNTRGDVIIPSTRNNRMWCLNWCKEHQVHLHPMNFAPNGKEMYVAVSKERMRKESLRIKGKR